mmetsp:Transcript_14834/g.44810  ORF Transcript_14834/g.44810 Transcript_14834/m.44810 type:complete len:285 (-) Transcript_14834:180-1034(-)
MVITHIAHALRQAPIRCREPARIKATQTPTDAQLHWLGHAHAPRHRHHAAAAQRGAHATAPDGAREAIVGPLSPISLGLWQAHGSMVRLRLVGLRVAVRLSTAIRQVCGGASGWESAGGRHLITWHCTLDLYLLLVQRLQRSRQQHRLHRLLLCERNEPEAPWPAVVVIVHNHCILHAPELLEILPEGSLVNGRRQSAYEYLFGAPGGPTTAAAPSSWPWMFLLRHSLFCFHLPPVDSVPKAADFVCNRRILENHEAKAPRPPRVSVIGHERFQDLPKVGEISF